MLGRMTLGINHVELTSAVIEDGIKVVDVAQAVAAQRKGVGAVAQPVVSDIKGALPHIWLLCVRILPHTHPHGKWKITGMLATCKPKHYKIACKAMREP